MFDTETVTTRPAACGVADIFPAASIRDMIHPPKISPLGLQSAGMAKVREASSPLGSGELRGLPLLPIPALRPATRPDFVATQHSSLNVGRNIQVLEGCGAQLPAGAGAAYFTLQPRPLS